MEGAAGDSGAGAAGDGGGDHDDDDDDGDDGDGTDGGARGEDPNGPGRYLVGQCTLSLRQMLSDGFEPLTEPIDLHDGDGALSGMLRVSLLARDALSRARRAALKGASALELWIGAESVLLAPALRASLVATALWVEAHLEVSGLAASEAAAAARKARRSTSPTSPEGHALSGGAAASAPLLHVVSARVRMPQHPHHHARGSPGGGGGGGGGGGLASALPIHMSGRISLPSGSKARAALQRALHRAPRRTARRSPSTSSRPPPMPRRRPSATRSPSRASR